MNGVPRPLLIPGVLRPKENNNLPHCFSRLNLFVEKKHADNNSTLNDNKILCFKAYFCQNYDNSKKYQIRPVKILYFTEDGTIQVVEPSSVDSRLPLCIVKRQQIPCDLPGYDKYLTCLDLNVQKQVKILDRIYTITDCDQITRSYLSRTGIDVPESIKIPEDPLHLSHEQCKRPDQTKEHLMEVSKHEKFLSYENLRLKFDASWDDRHSPFGEIHKLNVFFYLSDNTIQIIEYPKNERPFVFYKRLKLPKKTEDVFTVHQKSNPLVLGNFMLDKCVVDKSVHGKSCNVDFYTAADLKIGQVLNVFGRKVVLIGCDEFTREFQRRNKVEEFVLDDRPGDVSQRKPADIQKATYNCLDSLKGFKSNRLLNELRERQRNMKKFLEQDNSKLRFKAHMLTKIGTNSNREFLITYYLDDDTISVFEIGDRKFSSSGEFLKRAKFCSPQQSSAPTYRPEPYASKMFYIGATMDLNRHLFHLIDADEFTLNYMESHESGYPMASISSIMSKVREAIMPICEEFFGKYLAEVPLTKDGLCPETIQLSNQTTALALRELLGDKIKEHEIITVLRYFSADKSSDKSQAYDRMTIQSMVQTALATRFWDNIQGLKDRILKIGLVANSYVQPDRLFSVIKSCRVPVKDILISDMFSVLKKDQNGNIDVSDFLDFIDSKKCRAPPIQPSDPYSDEHKRAFNSNRPKFVDWSAFISELGL